MQKLSFGGAKAYIFIYFSMLVLACGEGDGQRSKRPALPPVLSDTSLTRQYNLADPECIAGSKTPAVGSAQVWKMSAGEVRAVEFSTIQWLAGPVLAGGTVQQTFFDFHQQSQCEYVDGELNCNGTARVVNSKRSLRICNPEGRYPRESIEGVALNAMSSLNEAHEFYRSLTTVARELPAANLLVLPKVEKVIKMSGSDGVQQSKSLVESDNLAYTPSFEGRPTFIVYPMGKLSEALKIWQGFNLWESPWVLAHEFGHHVFRNHTGLTRTNFDTALDWQEIYPPIIPTVSGDGSGEQADLPSVERLSLVTNSAEDAKRRWASVNEGFADLFAFYAGGARISEARYLDCFRASRDVLSANFTDGSLKRLSAENLAVFHGKKVPPAAINGCDSANFRDVHTVGAVVAFGLNALFVEALRTSSVDPSDASALANLLLSYANALAELVERGDAASAEFSEILAPALTVAAVQGKLTSRQCVLLRQVFTNEAEAMLQDAGLTCR